MIRLLDTDDLEAFRTLRQAALEAHPESYATSGQDWRNAPAEKIAALLRPGVAGGLPILGLFAPALVGMIGLRRNTEVTAFHKAAVWGLFVTENYRGRGAGRHLVEAAVAQARALSGLEMLWLVTTTDNAAALRVFEQTGFATYGIEPRARYADGVYYDQAYMSRRLDAL